MKKRVFGKRFKRDINQRKGLFRGLMRDLIIHGRIQTTEAKAKSIKGEVEKMITKAKKQGEDSRVHLQRYFTQDIIDRMINDIAPVFKDRPGGYTRIMRVGNRVKDNAPMVMMEWVEVVVSSELAEPVKKRKETRKKAVKTTEKKETITPTKEDEKAKTPRLGRKKTVKK